jgi:type II secretory pathway predicted ATPase ExeA
MIMREFVFRMDIDPRQYLAQELELPVQECVESMVLARLSIDHALTLRTGVALVGGKGTGKTTAAIHAQHWHRERERITEQADGGFTIRRVARAPSLRRLTYRQTGIALAKNIDESYTDRVRGRRKEDADICTDVVELCSAKGYALIIVDEAEYASAETLAFLRDVITNAREAALRSGSTKAAGVGMLLIGETRLLKNLRSSEEAGYRWSVVKQVPPVSVEEVSSLLEAWFPAFQTHIDAVGRESWTKRLSSMFGGSAGMHLHKVRDVALLYAYYVSNSNYAVEAAHQIRFIEPAFVRAVKDVSWIIQNPTDEAGALGGPQLTLGTRKVSS